jgi:hypothetical protein
MDYIIVNRKFHVQLLLLGKKKDNVAELSNNPAELITITPEISDSVAESTNNPTEMINITAEISDSVAGSIGARVWNNLEMISMENHWVWIYGASYDNLFLISLNFLSLWCSYA